MRSYTCLVSATLAASLVFLPLSTNGSAQESGTRWATVAELPDAPSAQIALASAEPLAQQTSDSQSQTAPQLSPSATAGQAGTAQSDGTAQGSSSSQDSTQPPAKEKSQHDKAEEQIKEQEQQRLVGVVPQFNISYRADAVSMTAGQKMKLAFRSAVDPVAFGVAAVAAGYHEARDDDPGFGWGIEGYGKRWGAAYLDAFDGNIIGNGILPSLLRQDPRYFRLGHGTVTHRLLYSLATNVICKGDKTRKWEPNYSNVSGNIISGAISNLYYPSSNSGIGQTFTNGFIVTAEGGLGSIFDEFWPDISRKFLHRDPTHGLDAQARAADRAEKEAKENQKSDGPK
jgi:hypothetical protein